ncbi:MAG: undecaprenyldiphospho-muramoylpentapeptide beta-N-acetylglucosaminyltransferase [Chitinophagaceae bacterium]|nr:undecaprenyldiphospho-muramoylpentapeptide beta-N-acetylglucosaminyltransferase [Chitinophagaceae bacterium]
MTNAGKHIKVIIAGGGTGGHIFPGLAIAGALQRLQPAVEILYVGDKTRMEMQRVPEAGYKIIGLTIAGFNRSTLWKNWSLPFKLIASFFQVRSIFKKFKPDAVVGVGGYSSFPVLRYAQSCGIPSFIHESNSLAGRSNMMIGKKATKIFVASDGMEKYFPKDKLVVTGNPVRAELSDKVGKGEAIKIFGLQPDKKTVLAIGGSLGAKSINEAIQANLDAFKKEDIQLIWQTGKNFKQDVNFPNEEYKGVWCQPFIGDMRKAYGAADVVVARAGAMTIAELKIQNKASILIPYPYAAEDHQTVNARALVDKQAAVMIADRDVKQELMPQLLKLMSDEAEVKKLENNIGLLAVKDADTLIAREILNNLKS